MNKMVLLMNVKRRGIELVIFQDVLLCSQAIKEKRDGENGTSYIFFVVLAQTAFT